MRLRGISPSKAERDFREWAALFAGKLFVKLSLYVDESGTHDATGQARGATEAMIAGLVAPVDDWAEFTRRWQRALNKYDAPYFHYCEWSDAASVARGKRKPSSSFKNNPYQGWTHEKLDAFAIGLATIVGTTNAVYVGRGVTTHGFNRLKSSGALAHDANPYVGCMEDFYADLMPRIASRCKPWKRMPITVFFDQSGNAAMQKSALDSHRALRKAHPNLKEISFVDKLEHLPIQAADMVSYRTRQIESSALEGKTPYIWEAFDSALFKREHDFLDHHPSVVEAIERNADRFARAYSRLPTK